MRCRKAERLVSRAFDKLLNEQEEARLKAHLEKCGECRQDQEEYTNIQGCLKQEYTYEPEPYFVERFKSRLKPQKTDPLAVWRQWGVRTVSVSILLILLLSAAILFFSPPQQQELSRSEALLLRNRNPFQEAQPLLDAKSTEDQNMTLIFASLEENGFRR